MEDRYDLTVEQVANLAECHRSTVLRYERDGYLTAMRDHNNYRRYTKRDAMKLKDILNIRRPTPV